MNVQTLFQCPLQCAFHMVCALTLLLTGLPAFRGSWPFDTTGVKLVG